MAGNFYNNSFLRKIALSIFVHLVKTGGGYILSKKAVKKFVKKIRNDYEEYFYPDGDGEDCEM